MLSQNRCCRLTMVTASQLNQLATSWGVVHIFSTLAIVTCKTLKCNTLRHTADALSRAYLKTTDGALSEFCEIRAVETVDHKEHILVEPPKRDVFRERIAADGDIQELILAIKLVKKRTHPPAVQPYYYDRGQLIESGDLIFRGEQLLVPPSLPRDKLTQRHSSHIGIGGCVRRAREICIGQE